MDGADVVDGQRPVAVALRHDGAVGIAQLPRLRVGVVQQFEPGKGPDRKVDLTMMYGTARTAVTQPVHPKNGKFYFRTKTATMGVRGTMFVVSATIGESTSNASAATSSANAAIWCTVPIHWSRSGR